MTFFLWQVFFGDEKKNCDENIVVKKILWQQQKIAIPQILGWQKFGDEKFFIYIKKSVCKKKILHTGDKASLEQCG